MKEAIENASKIGTRGKTKGQVVAATPNMKSNIKGLLNDGRDIVNRERQTQGF